MFTINDEKKIPKGWENCSRRFIICPTCKEVDYFILHNSDCILCVNCKTIIQLVFDYLVPTGKDKKADVVNLEAFKNKTGEHQILETTPGKETKK